MKVLFFRSEIEKYFCSFFGSNENCRIFFRDYLTFSRSRSDKQRTPAAHCKANIVAVGSNRVEQTSRIKGHSKGIPIQYDPLKIIQIFPPFHQKTFDLKLHIYLYKQESRQLHILTL